MLGRIADEYDTIKPVKFIYQMELAYEAADLVISRAGALTISELCMVGKPVVFVPSPNGAEDHQTKNAMALVAQDAAEIVEDKEAIDNLVDKALAILNSTDRINTLSANIKILAKPDATKNIANQVIQLIK
jgi:UDP-N-acetylglucosamine--N-acetylmuramyl-(pentapeptide) pyrophosphoryl-undecaprenol N-acetylglucosamine transferase